MAHLHYPIGTMPPSDEHNERLIRHVHPPGWLNPDPAGRYNLVVFGAGTAGLVTAAVAAALGARVALIERHLMGGDCLNVGCVPSKAVIRASRVWSEIKHGKQFGVETPEGTRYDFGAAMARMRKLRAQISYTDSVERFSKLGVDVYMGEGRFTAPDAVEVDGKRLTFSRAAICTGARAAAPPIPGLEETGYLTNETLFTLTALPRRLGVIGAGPIGCEMAQSFARFGSQVTLFEQSGQILPREDSDAAAIVQSRMERDGVRFVFGSKARRIEKRDGGRVIVSEREGKEISVVVDEILVGIGRAPNVEGIGLEKAGVDFDSRMGIQVNHRLQTANPRIYAAGDVCSAYKFTHAADAQAQIVIQNALFPHPLGLGYADMNSLIMPWCTYTDPEIAHVGMYEQEAEKNGVGLETFTYSLEEVDRAILDGEDEGFARIHVRKGTDKILGATIVAAHAGEMIGEVSVAMGAGAGLATILKTIHPYPTQAEVIKKAANLWRKAAFTENKKKILSRWFAWTR